MVSDASRVDWAIFRPWPFGGGGNLALARSIARYSTIPQVRMYQNPWNPVTGAISDGSNFKVLPLKTWSLHLGATWLARVDDAEMRIGAARVIDIAELANGYSYQLATISSKLGRPLVVTCLETLGPTLVTGLPPWNLYSNRVKRAASLYRVATQRSRLALESQGVAPERIRVIPIGVDTSLFQPASTHRVLDDVKFLFARRVERKNGILELLSAFKKINRKHPRTRLAVVGAGPLVSAVQDAARSLPISYSPPVPYSDLPRVYNGSDIFCNPAKDLSVFGRCVQEDGQYTFPILEAQACGLQVISSASGAYKELLSESALVVPQGDGSSLESAMEEAMDPATRMTASNSGRSFIQRNHDAKNLQARMDREIRRLGEN